VSVFGLSVIDHILLAVSAGVNGVALFVITVGVVVIVVSLRVIISAALLLHLWLFSSLGQVSIQE